MFTGIVKGLATIVHLDKKPGLVSLTLETSEGFTHGLATGASVAIDGVCLTAVAIERNLVSFDAMEETLQKTTIGLIQIGSQVNVERSFHVGDEIGGHIVSGHVTGMGEITSIDTPENNQVFTIRVSQEWMKYILPKGFIGIDGCSLTIVHVDKVHNTFTVWLIPETLRLTTFGFKKTGDHVNIEIDSRTQAIVDTVIECLRSGNLDLEKLEIQNSKLEGNSKDKILRLKP